MKKRAVRQIAAAMAVVMAATTAGCGSAAKEEGTVAVTGTESAKTEAKEEKLVVAIQTNSFITDYEDNYFTHYMEDKLGIDIEFYLLPTSSDEVKTKISLMASSGEDLPDVLLVDGCLSTESILQYGSSGVFLSLNEYLGDSEKMPNYNKIPEEDKVIMEAAQTMADGNMYSLSKYEPMTWNATPYRNFINRAWLDKLGLEVPKTTDELKEVLIAFRDQDPNGNGVADEIGIYGMQSGGYGQNVTASLMNAFTFWNGSVNGGLTLNDDGTQVIAPFTTEEWKQGLLYMNDLYKEGLLSPSIFIDDETQFKATLNGETNVVGFVSIGSLGNYTEAATNKNFLEMELIEPLAGPQGIRYTPYAENCPQQEMMIFADTDNVDLAIRFADEFFDPYTSIVSRNGEEGVDWTVDEKDLEGRTNAYVEEGLYDKVTMAILQDVWAVNNTQTWHCVNPRYSSLDTNNTVSESLNYNKDDPTQLVAKSLKLYFDKHPEHILTPLHYTVEEVEEIQDAIVNIPEYVSQMMAEFITGARDIESEWDAYLAELNGMGLEQWLACAQAAYGR